MRFLNFFIFLFFIIQISARNTSNKLLLSVYYESNCPDSKVFILKQLEPALQLLHSYVKLKLVPFGKSKSINYGDEGFVCQHGSPECLGNMIQDCALHLMKDRSDIKKLSYVACEMKTEAASQGILDCVKQARLPVNVVEDCALNGQGTVLQLESEYFTSLVSPKFIPTVTINGVFDQAIQDNAQIDLFGTLCSVMTEVPPCARYYNKIAMTNLMYAGRTYYNLDIQ